MLKIKFLENSQSCALNTCVDVFFLQLSQRKKPHNSCLVDPMNDKWLCLCADLYNICNLIRCHSIYERLKQNKKHFSNPVFYQFK